MRTTKPSLWWALLMVGCSSSTTVETNVDGGSGGSSANPEGGGSSGSGGASGSAGSAGSGSGGSAGTGGTAGVSGTGGSAGTAGSGDGGPGGTGGVDGSAGSAGSSGSGGSGGACSPTNVTVDFKAQGNVQRDQFVQAGVSIVGTSDLQFSDEASTMAFRPGLGVVGGVYNWSIDSEEFVTITFTPNAATNVRYYVEGLDVDDDDVFGETAVTAYAMTGEPIETLTITDTGSKNISALFGNVPISKLTIRTGEDGVVLQLLSFTACLE
jgi:hypothetical protein